MWHDTYDSSLLTATGPSPRGRQYNICSKIKIAFVFRDVHVRLSNFIYFPPLSIYLVLRLFSVVVVVECCVVLDYSFSYLIFPPTKFLSNIVSNWLPCGKNDVTV